jgi:cytochrome c
MQQRSGFAIALLALASGHALGAGDAEHGKALYQARCTACHSIEYNGPGPAHKGVFGRKAGSAPGFAYSKALRDANVVWSEETLAKWLENPEAFIPGQRMFVQTPDGVDRADLIAYLKGVAGP